MASDKRGTTVGNAAISSATEREDGKDAPTVTPARSPPITKRIADLVADEVAKWRRIVAEENSTLAQPCIGGRRAIPDSIKAQLHISLFETLKAHRPDLASWCLASDFSGHWSSSLIFLE